MASKKKSSRPAKKPSRAAKSAAKAFLAPSKEETAALKLLAANTDAIIRIEKTLALLLKNLCGETKRNYALRSLHGTHAPGAQK